MSKSYCDALYLEGFLLKLTLDKARGWRLCEHRCVPPVTGHPLCSKNQRSAGDAEDTLRPCFRQQWCHLWPHRLNSKCDPAQADQRVVWLSAGTTGSKANRLPKPTGPVVGWCPSTLRPSSKARPQVSRASRQRNEKGGLRCSGF